MSDMDGLRRTQYPELGSLENPTGKRVKRITVQELRTLKSQEQLKQGFSFTLNQIVARGWKDLIAFFSYKPRSKRGAQNCELYGHSVIRTPGGFEPRCRFCDTVIVDTDQLRAKI